MATNHDKQHRKGEVIIVPGTLQCIVAFVSRGQAVGDNSCHHVFLRRDDHAEYVGNHYGAYRCTDMHECGTAAQ